MKQIYIPTREELSVIESYKNTNIYKYILSKVVEKMLTSFTYINAMDSDLKEIKELRDSICYIYPQELGFNIEGQHDKNLCSRILDKKQNDEVYNLDNLCRFNEDIMFDLGISLKVIDLLYKGLQTNPEYRFTYKENVLLNSIFNLDYQKFMTYPDGTIKKLIEIEPMYVLKLPNNTMTDDNIRLAVAIDEYAYKYGIPFTVGKEYIGKNIVNNPDEKGKKLIKYLYK